MTTPISKREAIGLIVALVGVALTTRAAAQEGPAGPARPVVGGAPVGPTSAVPPAPRQRLTRTEISLPAAELDKFVGRYDFGSDLFAAVTREGGSLYVLREGVPGAIPLQIVPEAPLAFFWRAMDAQIRFIMDAGGAVTGAEITQVGQTLTGWRIKP